MKTLQSRAGCSRTRLRLVLSGFGAAAVLGCEDGGPTALEAPTCSSPEARIVRDSLSGVLTARDGPYVLEDTVLARALRIEAGTLLCGRADAVLRVQDTLIVTGTAERPVVFTALDPAHPWGGISGRELRTSGFTPMGGAQVTMSHAVVEHAGGGVIALVADLRSVRFRQIGGGAVQASGRLVDVRADTVCTDGLSCAALGTPHGGRGSPLRLTIDRVLVRSSGGHGLDVSWTSAASIDDLTMEEIAGSAVSVASWRAPWSSGVIEIRGPVRIRGQRGYLAQGDADAVSTLMAADGVHAQPGDSVLSVGNITRPVAVGPGVRWRAIPNDRVNVYGLAFDDLSVAAGGEFELVTYSASFRSLDLRGVAGNPARFVSPGGVVIEGGPMVLEHALVRVAHRLEARGGTEQRIVDSAVEAIPALIDADALRLDVLLSAPRARVERSTFDRAGLALGGIGSAVSAARVTRSPGHGITLGADSVVVSGCAVTLSAQNGIHVTSGGGVVVRECDLEQNGGAGVANDGPLTVLARRNWWGDAAGPSGPAGDGVMGAVDVQDFRTSRTQPAVARR